MTEQKIAKNRKKTKIASTTSDIIKNQHKEGFYQGGILINLYLLRCVHLTTSSDFFSTLYLVGPLDSQFFCQAQLAVHSAAAVRLGYANGGPFYDRNTATVNWP